MQSQLVSSHNYMSFNLDKTYTEVKFVVFIDFSIMHLNDNIIVVECSLMSTTLISQNRFISITYEEKGLIKEILRAVEN